MRKERRLHFWRQTTTVWREDHSGGGKNGDWMGGSAGVAQGPLGRQAHRCGETRPGWRRPATLRLPFGARALGLRARAGVGSTCTSDARATVRPREARVERFDHQRLHWYAGPPARQRCGRNAAIGPAVWWA